MTNYPCDNEHQYCNHTCSYLACTHVCLSYMVVQWWDDLQCWARQFCDTAFVTHATHLATPSENTSRADAPATTNLYFLSHDLSANCFGLVYRQIKILFTRHRLIHVHREGDNWVYLITPSVRCSQTNLVTLFWRGVWFENQISLNSNTSVNLNVNFVSK